MRFSHLLAVASLGVCMASCGSSGPELTKTASGTWMSPRVQGEKWVILSTATAPVEKGVLSLTVMDLTMGFLPQGEILKRPDEAGKQIVRVGIKASNVGTQDADLQFNNFEIQLKNGTPGQMSFFINQANASDFLQSKRLKPGESTEGAVYYELPATAVRNDLILEYHSGDTQTALSLVK